MARIFCLIFLLSASCTQAHELDKKFEKGKFQIGKKEFTAYVADNNEKRAQGLMNIKSLPPDTGMLFVFENEEILSFWMKNTFIPLSIGFINAKGLLVDIQEMKPAASIMLPVPTYQSRASALFALEMNTGWFSSHGIKNGDRLKRLSSTKSHLLNTKLEK